MAFCSLCRTRIKTNSQLDEWLAANMLRVLGTFAWDVRVMSQLEQQEMRETLGLEHQKDLRWIREYKMLKHHRQENARLARQQQLLWQKQSEQSMLEQKQSEQSMLRQQQQELFEQERKLLEQERMLKQEQLLDAKHRKQLEFQREFHATLQDYKLLWCLQNGNEQHPQHDRAQRHERPNWQPDRAPRFPCPPGPSHNAYTILANLRVNEACSAWSSISVFLSCRHHLC
jgi:hypothetical protein